ncbi:hypothetical protein Cni_G18772 [Canna indica]|uniref:Uncharacterized protein n=1 Tax=Canna indica TaxID=4628 RepID=A0AAQ3QI08_9LILI|nr:hypothetical protein Cni_G18772 [Canna indica]
MMKRGAKRSAFASDPVPDSGPQSKRVMDTPSFDVHRVESSHQHLMAGPPLDPQRVESAYQHVKALNSQFASWVQLQLQNHPDELWEDGVGDYLSHASSIMEKFKDVVGWLKANSGKQRSMPIEGSSSEQKNLVDSEHNKDPRHSNLSDGSIKQHATTSISSLQKSSPQSSGLFSFSETPNFAVPNSQKSFATLTENNKATPQSGITNGISKQVTPASFSGFHNSSLQSTSVFSSSQKPMFSGNQSDTSAKVEASNNLDEEDDPEKPSSPSLQKAEEKGIIVVHEAKCKVYVKPDNPSEKGWKDMGMGHLSIKCNEGVEKATKASRPTIVIRNDMHKFIRSLKELRACLGVFNQRDRRVMVGKILLNALIYHGIKMNIQKNTIASIFHITGGADNWDTVARTYLLKLKNEEETTKLATAIKDYTPSA